MLLLKLINIEKHTQTHACYYDIKRLNKTKKLNKISVAIPTTVLRAAKTLMNE